MKNLLICENCKYVTKRGDERHQILGEVNNGTLSIMRYSRAFTLVDGENFNVYCSVCGDKVYMKRKEVNEREMGSERGSWFFRIESGSFTGTIGA